MVHLFLLKVHIKKYFTYWNWKYWHLVQGKTAKQIVFGSDFLTYGAPFYKWCHFTYGAVTNVKRELPYRLDRDVNVKREFMTCDRETRAWNRSLHVAIFHVHSQYSRARNKNKKTSFYARGNRETNWIHHKCPVLYEQSLK